MWYRHCLGTGEYTHTHIHTNTHTRTHTHIDTHRHTNTHTRTHTHIDTHRHTNTHTNTQSALPLLGVGITVIPLFGMRIWYWSYPYLVCLSRTSHTTASYVCKVPVIPPFRISIRYQSSICLLTQTSKVRCTQMTCGYGLSASTVCNVYSDDLWIMCSLWPEFIWPQNNMYPHDLRAICIHI